LKQTTPVHLVLLLFPHLAKFLDVVFQRLRKLAWLPVTGHDVIRLVVIERDDVTADVIASDADVIGVVFFATSGQRQYVADVGVVPVEVLIVAVIFCRILASGLQFLGLEINIKEKVKYFRTTEVIKQVRKVLWTRKSNLFIGQGRYSPR